jgi:hypothetical protein
MGQFEVREASASDWDGVARGFARVSDGDVDLVRQKVLHTMADNPHGCSSLVAVDTSGRVIGHLGVSHVPMHVKGEEQLFGRFNACFIDEAYRVGGVHGLFLELDRMFQERFEVPERLAAVFGQWDELDWWLLRHLRGHDAVATSIDLRHGVERPDPGGAGGNDDGDDEIQITNTIDAAAPSDRLDTGACHVRRDGRFAAWRAAFPGASDQGWQAWRAGELCGMAITRDRDGERLILDWAVAPDDAATGHALLRSLVGEARTPVRARFWTSDLFTLTLFQDAGFLVAAGPEAYLSVRAVQPRINHLWLSQEWQVTMADAGVRPLPRLTVGEPIVSPPSPGTLGGRERYGH